VHDLLVAIAEGKSVQPDFHDGLRCQQVLDAVVESGQSGRWVTVPSDD